MVSFKHILKVLSHKKMLEALIAVSLVAASVIISLYISLNESQTRFAALTSDKSKVDKAYQELKNQDQYKINEQLKEDLKKTHDNYSDSISLYEKITDLRAQKQDTKELDKLYAQVIKSLADLKYGSAEGDLKDLSARVKKINDELAAKAAAAGSPAGPATESNTPPGSGYSYQAVKTEIGTYNIALVAADLNSTRVIIDTASDGTCTNECPTLPLATYVSRSGAFAGINGSYFCPAEYPSCAGKTNSFDTLLMNKNKVYFNGDNNVYSNVPVAVFGAGFARFIGASSGWGRDTSIDGVIANQPLLLSGGNIAFGGGSDPKQGSKGARSFVGHKGSTVYIGVVYNATAAEVAYVLKALGMEDALNLDSGGSTALWSGGYKAGPGRNIPNAILFVRR